MYDMYFVYNRKLFNKSTNEVLGYLMNKFR